MAQDNEQDARKKQTYASFGGRPARLLGDGGQVLTYEGFTSAPGFAVKEAYLMHIAQRAARLDPWATGEALVTYVTCRCSFDDAKARLVEIANEAAEAAAAEIAATKEG